MPRPAWMRCELCFWEEDQWCNYDNVPEETVDTRFCHLWRCKNCEMDFDDEDYDSEKPDGFVPNHEECMEILVELEED